MPTPPSSSSTVDLTTSGTSGVVDGAVFDASQVNAGTGTFPAFLSITHTGTEQGYNSDFRPVQFNETTNANHNHSLLLANIPIVEGDGTHGTTEGMLYRQFLFDANEPNSGDGPLLSLDRLQIYQELSGNLGGTYNSSSGPIGGFNVAGEHLVYDLDATGDHWIALNANLSSGSGKSDIELLIPESFFDSSVPYVYLYSAFGLQGDGWQAGNGNEEWAVAGGHSGQGGGSKAALNITKSAAVDGGTADHAGEVITYSMTLANTGNVNLTGITVSDPSVFDLTRGVDQVGNNDNVLNVGEIWTYTAHHVVTQEEIDSAALRPAATIDNTVSAGSDQTGHLPAQLDYASTAVPLESRPIVSLDKAVSSIVTSDETPGHVNAAGDVINYTFSVAWGTNANTSLTGVVVSDPTTVDSPVLDASAPVPNLNAQLLVPVLDGDSNLGDNNNNGIVDPTDGNGARDPGETFQYVYLGDTNQDGFHDPGETWVAYNLSDTNQNGVRDGLEAQFVGDANNNSVEDAGEKWQFKNLADTNNNGLQDNGEAWTQYQNVGDNNQNGTQDTGETFQYYNAGDTNQNGVEDPGETFQYYNVGDTNHNGVEDTGETFQFDHNVPAVDVNMDGFNDGDVNFDGKINATETWQFAASYTITQADIDHRVGGVPTVVSGLTHTNTATVTTNEEATASDSVSVFIDQNPHLQVTKTASIPDTSTAGDPTLNDGKIDSPADDITYTISVLNNGNMTLTSVSVNDSLAGMLTTHTETGGNPATNGDGELNVGETWTYTRVYDTQQSDIDNRGNVDGSADDNIHNLATVTTAQGASDSDFADVAIDYRPHMSVDKTASIPDSDGDGKIDSPADDITYTVVVTNDGNVTLTGVTANDSITGSLTSHTDSGAGTHGDANLDVGETWTYTAVYDTQQSDIDNRGNVDGTADDNIHNTVTVTSTQGAGGTDSADVAIDYNPNFTFSVTTLGYHDENNNGTADAGDIIDFSTSFTNIGNVTLTNIAISSEDGLIAWTNPIASLAPGGTDSTTITGTHVIQSGESSLDETEIGQSDQVGNILVPVHVEYADLTPIPDMGAAAQAIQLDHQAQGII